MNGVIIFVCLSIFLPTLTYDLTAIFIYLLYLYALLPAKHQSLGLMELPDKPSLTYPVSTLLISYHLIYENIQQHV